jgi:hypothetical protein
MSACNNCDETCVCEDCPGEIPYDIEDTSSTDDDTDPHPSGEQAEQMAEYRKGVGL